MHILASDTNRRSYVNLLMGTATSGNFIRKTMKHLFIILFLLLSITCLAQTDLVDQWFISIPYKSNIDDQLSFIKKRKDFGAISSRTTPSKTIYRVKVINPQKFSKSCDSIVVGWLLSSDSSVIKQKSYKRQRTFVEYYYPSEDLLDNHLRQFITELKKRYKISRKITLGDSTTPEEDRFEGLEFSTNKNEPIPYIGIYKNNVQHPKMLLLEYCQHR